MQQTAFATLLRWTSSRNFLRNQNFHWLMFWKKVLKESSMLQAISCKILSVASISYLKLPSKMREFSMFSKKLACMHRCNMQVFPTKSTRNISDHVFKCLSGWIRCLSDESECVVKFCFTFVFKSNNFFCSKNLVYNQSVQLWSSPLLQLRVQKGQVKLPLELSTVATPCSKRTGKTTNGEPRNNFPFSKCIPSYHQP